LTSSNRLSLIRKQLSNWMVCARIAGLCTHFTSCAAF
jgi:hypothetical protein